RGRAGVGTPRAREPRGAGEGPALPRGHRRLAAGGRRRADGAPGAGALSVDAANDSRLSAETARLSRAAFIVGLLALMGGIAYGTAHPAEFFRSYLLAFMFWNGLTVGSLAVLMLQYLTGGAWGISIRRELEAATRTLPLTAIAFLPIALGMHTLYEWTHADVVAHDELLHRKAGYLNAPFFLF